MEQSVLQSMRDACEAAKEEQFEDGMESRFSTHLCSLIQQYRVDALQAIEHLIRVQHISVAVLEETMRELGQIDDPATYDGRIRLLKDGLQHTSPRVRDGASLGLASLDDPQAIP